MTKLGDFELDQIYTGDARELSKGIPDASVDLVFTDPPYIAKYIPLYGWLAREAVRILKPDGFALVYTGDYWKDVVMTLMREHLKYYWDFILVQSGFGTMIWARRIIARNKSILAYQKKDSTARPRTNVLSRWEGSGGDKRFHTWGQDESSARYYIDCFSKPGDIVYDPFCGGGTTSAIAKMTDRNYLTFELDPTTADIARSRIANLQPLLFQYHNIQQAEFETGGSA
jgi:DNA modification methylase